MRRFDIDRFVISSIIALVYLACVGFMTMIVHVFSQNWIITGGIMGAVIALSFGVYFFGKW